MIKFSFIIPTVDRINELQNCTASIERAYELSGKKTIEIIIIFNGNNNGSCNLTHKYPSLFKYVRLEKNSVSKARNLGIEMSQGDYLIFLDDDASVKENYLKVLSENILTQNAQIFYGRILNPLDASPFTDVYYKVKPHCVSFFDYHYSGGTSLVIERRIMEKVGLYDENFGPGEKYPAAEESDLFFRLLQAGEIIWYVPELVLFHPFPEAVDPKKTYQYAYAFGAMLMKQILCDPRHFFYYLLVILTLLFKGTIRALQNCLFPKTIKNKAVIFNYSQTLIGLIKGLADYLSIRWRLHLSIMGTKLL